MKYWKTVTMQVFDHVAFRAEREKREISARSIALEAGVSPAFLCEIEAGKPCSDEVAAKLIGALGKLKVKP